MVVLLVDFEIVTADFFAMGLLPAFLESLDIVVKPLLVTADVRILLCRVVELFFLLADGFGCVPEDFCVFLNKRVVT